MVRSGAFPTGRAGEPAGSDRPTDSRRPPSGPTATVARAGPTDRGPGQAPVFPASRTRRLVHRPGFGHATLKHAPKEDVSGVRCTIGGDDGRSADGWGRSPGLSNDDAP